MSTKKTKRVVAYLAAFLIIITLICTCLVGNTFAKYVTGTVGTAKSELSLWGVQIDNTNTSLKESNTVKFGGDDSSLSPNTSGYNSGSYVYHSTAVMPVASLSIDTNTEVNLTVTLSGTAVSYAPTNYNSGHASSPQAVVYGTANTDSIVETGVPTQAEVEGVVLKLHVAYIASAGEITSWSTNVTVSDSTGVATATSGDLVDDLVVSSAYSKEWIWSASDPTDNVNYIYVYAWVTWTTQYANSSYSSAGSNNDGKDANGIYYADKLDAWVGQNIDSLSTTITLMAVQTSQNPT